MEECGMKNKFVQILEEHLLGLTIAFLIAFAISTILFDFNYTTGVIPSLLW
jgi:hypothetical protein